jgi:excisionase family DNA binding protein
LSEIDNPNKIIEYLTPEEAGEVLKVSPSTIKKWLRAGKLKGSKLGGSNGVWVTTRQACDDLYNEGKNY